MSGNNLLAPTSYTTLLVGDTVATSGGSNDSIPSIQKIGGGVPLDSVTALTSAYAASTTTLNATYSNGTAGVGATLTNAGANAAFSIDSVSPTLNSIILIKDQTDATQNGIYTLTTVGDGGTPWVLTRSTSYDSAAEIYPGTYLAVTNGTVNGGLSYVEVYTVTTVGTDDISFRLYVGLLPAAIGISLQSTTGCLYLNGVTTTERDAFQSSSSAIADGMICYNATDHVFNFRQNGDWITFGTGGPVDGPVSSTNNAIARWDGTGGNTLQDSVVLVGDTGAITGALTIAVDDGAIGAPAYTFTGDTDTGMWHSGANTIDFSTNSLRAFQIAAAPAVSVNYLTVTPSSAGNPVILASTGTDSAVNIELFPKGTTTGQVVMPVGAIATPAVTFLGDLDTGLWHSGANTLDVSTNALRAFQFGAAPAVSVNYIVATPQATNAGNAALQPKLAAAGSDTNIGVAVSGKGTGGFDILPSSTAAAGKLTVWNGAGTFATSLAAGVNLANLALTLPIADASANAAATQTASFVALASNTAGVLSFSNTLRRYSRVTLNTAAVTGAFATAFEIIPAPGAGNTIVISQWAVELDAGATPFANGGAVALVYGTTAGAGATDFAATTVAAAFVNGAVDAIISAPGLINTTTGLAQTVTDNASVTLTNATGAFDTGNGALVVHVWYTILATV